MLQNQTEVMATMVPMVVGMVVVVVAVVKRGGGGMRCGIYKMGKMQMVLLRPVQTIVSAVDALTVHEEILKKTITTRTMMMTAKKEGGDVER